MKKTIACLLTAATLATLPMTFTTGCAVTQGRESTGAYAKDKEIMSRIKSDFYKDRDVKGTQISVASLNGVVQLSGFAETQMAKDRADYIARTTPGVLEVHNNILLPTGR